MLQYLHFWTITLNTTACTAPNNHFAGFHHCTITSATQFCHYTITFACKFTTTKMEWAIILGKRKVTNMTQPSIYIFLCKVFYHLSVPCNCKLIAFKFGLISSMCSCMPFSMCHCKWYAYTHCSFLKNSFPPQICFFLLSLIQHHRILSLSHSSICHDLIHNHDNAPNTALHISIAVCPKYSQWNVPHPSISRQWK